MAIFGARLFILTAAGFVLLLFFLAFQLGVLLKAILAGIVGPTVFLGVFSVLAADPGEEVLSILATCALLALAIGFPTAVMATRRLEKLTTIDFTTTFE